MHIILGPALAGMLRLVTFTTHINLPNSNLLELLQNRSAGSQTNPKKSKDPYAGYAEMRPCACAERFRRTAIQHMSMRVGEWLQHFLRRAPLLLLGLTTTPLGVFNPLDLA